MQVICRQQLAVFLGTLYLTLKAFFLQKASTEYVFIFLAKKCVGCRETTQYQDQATA